MLRLTLFLLAFVVATDFGFVLAAESLPKKPNFIFINVDDLGYADISPYGPKNQTPNLKRMADEGRKLTCFYAAPVCTPSRASLMTGCYPKRVLPIQLVLFPGDAEGLNPSEKTVAELLKEQGYATGIIGKWHLGDQPEFLPTNHGFDYYYGLPYSNDMGPIADGVKSNLGAPLPKTTRRIQPPLPLVRNNTVLQRVLPDDQQALVENYTKEAVSFIHQHRDEPFFLYLPHSAVHFPLYPGKKWVGKSGRGLHSDWCEEVDWSVGQVLETVRTLGLEKNTLVIFTSDNGGAVRHGATNTPLRGGKGSTFEGGMRTPTVAWWPGQIPAGTSTDEVTSTMDILPTLVRLAGGQTPTDRKLDGHDIWPIMSGAKNAKSPYDSFLFYRDLNLQAVRSGDWKLHLAKGDLYNLKDDISESKNLAKQNPQIVKQLRELAASQENDLGVKGKGPGCRPHGIVKNPKPLIDSEGKTRPGFELPAVHAAQGIMLGELTSTSVIAQVRLTKTDHLVANSYVARDKRSMSDVPGSLGVVNFQLTEEGSSRVLQQQRLIRVHDEHDFIARINLPGLKPNTKYILRTMIGLKKTQLSRGPTATFRTHPGKTGSESVKFVVVTGMNYAKFHGDSRIDKELHKKNNNVALPKPYAGADKHLGYPALDSILRAKPNFFVGTGDNVYYDTPPGDDHRAQTVPEMRQKWHEQFVQPRYRSLFAAVPTYWMIDDHDYRIDDGDNTGDHLPSSATALRVMLEQLPYGPTRNPNTKTYRTYRVSQDLQIWFTENRHYRSPNAMKDGPGKSIWGIEQREWLMSTLEASDAKFKLLISPTPLVGPDDLRKTDNHCDVDGFQHERDQFFAWLKESGVLAKNFYVICGDRHWQYHSIHPSGVEEFSCGALVDANSRPGRKPGDLLGTDPEGKIKQVYAQPQRGGGFLSVEVGRGNAASGEPRLTFSWHNVRGKVLHTHTKK